MKTRLGWKMPTDEYLMKTYWRHRARWWSKIMQDKFEGSKSGCQSGMVLSEAFIGGSRLFASWQSRYFYWHPMNIEEQILVLPLSQSSTSECAKTRSIPTYVGDIWCFIKKLWSKSSRSSTHHITNRTIFLVELGRSPKKQDHDFDGLSAITARWKQLSCQCLYVTATTMH